MLSPAFPVVHYQLLCLADVEGEVVVTDLLNIVCLIIICDQAYHRRVVSKPIDGVGVVRGHAVMGEQVLQEGTEHAYLRGARVEGQRGGCVP